jgi:hypothetical protein
MVRMRRPSFAAETGARTQAPALAQPRDARRAAPRLAPAGAVAARFRVHDAPVCVVCSHLASGDQEGDELRRNADAAEILRRCVFPTDAQAAALGVTGGWRGRLGPCGAGGTGGASRAAVCAGGSSSGA